MKPPQVRSLPDILTSDEISLLINSTREMRYQVYILTTYSMGLRLGEALKLTVGDIDSKRMRVHVRNGKGRKDRFVTLPKLTLLALRRYWATHRHPSLLFPVGKNPRERHSAKVPMDRGGMQKSFQAIVQSCNIHKRISIHSLRHCAGMHRCREAHGCARAAIVTAPTCWRRACICAPFNRSWAMKALKPPRFIPSLPNPLSKTPRL